MRRVMMSGFLMLAMGCAMIGSVGVNTSSHGIWYQDCGVSRSIPGGTATFKGTGQQLGAAVVLLVFVIIAHMAAS